MAIPKLFSLARMTTATTGTGTITLGAAATVNGVTYLSFAAAGVADGDIVAYAIADTSNSEYGYGTYTSAGTTLTRNVIRSTNSNNAISLSGSAQVFISAGSADLCLGKLPDIWNAKLSVTANSGTHVLTIAVKTQQGQDASALDPILIPMRSATAATDGYTYYALRAALSGTVASGATLGHTSGLANAIYVYFLDNSGTLELCWSSFFFGESGIVTTTADSSSADSATVMYSTTARTSKAFRFIGMVTSSQTTAGTWDTDPQNANPWPANFAFKGMEGFTATGTFTQRAGCYHAWVQIYGAGGGGSATVSQFGGSGGGYASRLVTGLPPGSATTVTIGAGGTAGNTGGDSWFGSSSSVFYVKATGGAGGGASAGAVGTGSGGDVNRSGSIGNVGSAGVIVGGGGPAGNAAPGAFGSGAIAVPTNTGCGGPSGGGGTGSDGYCLVFFW